MFLLNQYLFDILVNSRQTLAMLVSASVFFFCLFVCLLFFFSVNYAMNKTFEYSFQCKRTMKTRETVFITI